MTVFVVKSFGGEYEDSWEFIEGVFDSYDKAVECAKIVCRHYVPESPMTMEEFERCNYGEPDDANLIDYDINDGKIDRDGHTAEEFQQMEQCISGCNVRDFSCVEIETYSLNNEYENFVSERYWVNEIEGEITIEKQ